MSYGSELAEEMEINYAVMEATVESAAASGIWTTKDGQKLKICEMSTDHIQNTLNYIKRDSYREDFLSPFITAFEKELDARARIKTVLRELGIIQ